MYLFQINWLAMLISDMIVDYPLSFAVLAFDFQVKSF